MKKIILLFAMMIAVGTVSADRKYATFVAPTGSGGSYDAETCTYKWNMSYDNLMKVFSFSNGELANYKTLKIVRLGGTYTSSKTWRAYVKFKDGNGKSFIWYSYDDKSIDLSSGKWGSDDLTTGTGESAVTHTLADVTEISIGGNSDDGTEGKTTYYSVIIDETCVYLENDNDAVVTAAFAKLGNTSNATYEKKVYNATSGSNNLMDCYTKTVDGDLSKYGKLQFEIQNVTGMMRIGFHDGTNFTIIGESGGYGGGGVKHIDLSSYSTTATDATAIKFGAKDNSGRCTILPTNMFLVRSEAYTREFTAGQKSTVWLPFELSGSDVTSAGTFYELASVSDGTLHFNEVSSVEAYKPYVFVPAGSGTVTPFSGMKTKTIVAPKACSYTVDGYTFVGAMSDIKAPLNAYGWNSTNGTFSKVTAANAVDVDPFRGYITYNGGSGEARLNVIFDDETSGIETMSREPLTVNQTYNLSGQRVSQPTKGLYVVNGKKVVVK